MISTIDVNIYNFVLKIFSMQTTFIMTIISHLGSATMLIMLCVLFFVLFKDRRMPFIISVNLLAVFLLNNLIKLIIARPRPQVLNLVAENGYSFPSGHAMVATGFYGLLIYIIHKKMKNKIIKTLSIIMLAVLIFLIGLSRIYLGVHYATDIIGGFVIGTIYLISFLKIVKGMKVWKNCLQ